MARVTGRIRVKPPLAYPELKESPFNPDTPGNKGYGSGGRDVVFALDTAKTEVDDDLVLRITASALVPWSEDNYKGYEVEEHVEEAVVLHGAGHRFDGEIVIYGEDAGDISRVVVRDNEVTRERAEIRWPDGSTVD
jgi:hypothetical protein